MNQKRNKTNISARGTKRKLCRKARNKTNKKRGTYKRKWIRGGNPDIEDERKVEFIDKYKEPIIVLLQKQDKIDLYDNLLEIGSALAGVRSSDEIDERMGDLIDKTIKKNKITRFFGNFGGGRLRAQTLL